MIRWLSVTMTTEATGDNGRAAKRQPNNEWRWWRWWLFLLLFFFFRSFAFTQSDRSVNDDDATRKRWAIHFFVVVAFVISRKVEIIINTKITNAKEKVLKLFVSILRASNFRFSNSLLMLFVAATVDQTTHTHSYTDCDATEWDGEKYGRH